MAPLHLAGMSLDAGRWANALRRSANGNHRAGCPNSATVLPSRRPGAYSVMRLSPLRG